MANETDLKIDALLASWGVVYSTHYAGERDRGPSGEEWKNDAWTITFTNGTHQGSFDYFMGTGNRKSDQPAPDYTRINPRSLATKSWKKSHLKPVAPTAASVLYSLTSDADSTESGFSDWCADFGYNEDSRKALATFDACRDIAKRISRLFSREQLATLREMLQDY